MTRKQELFCEYYIESLNATQAAIKAGYSKKTAYSIGDENLRKPEIKKYIDRKMSEKTEIIMASQDDILKRLTDIAFMRMSIKVNYIDKVTGTLKSFDKYPDFNIQVKALELLGKHLGTWDSKLEELEGIVEGIVNGTLKRVN